MDEFVGAFVVHVMEEAAIAASASVRRRAVGRVDAFDLSDYDFKKNFRLSKPLVTELMRMVEPFCHQKEIDLKTKVLCALNFLGTGSYQTPTGNNYTINLSQPSVSRCLEEIVNVLNQEHIFNHWVHFPGSLQAINQIVRDFYQTFGFPGVVGVIDCTHIAIVPPVQTEFQERSYVNRKNYHSINTQLICDARLKILNVNARFPGSSHDSYIWNNSNVLNFMENLHQAGHKEFHLVGDSGYALRPWMLTPLSDPEEDTPAFRYNEALKKARCTIERCNGVLKARFRCLLKDRTLHYSPTKASKIITACTVLHNMCIENNDEAPELTGITAEQLGLIHALNEVQVPTSRQHNMLSLGRQKQDRIISAYFTN